VVKNKTILNFDNKIEFLKTVNENFKKNNLYLTNDENNFIKINKLFIKNEILYLISDEIQYEIKL